MLRRNGVLTVRIHVPTEVRGYVGRAELWRSTRSADPREGKLKAAIWEGHFAALFAHLRRHGNRMRRDQIDSLVSGYLAAQLDEVERRIASELEPYSGGGISDYFGSRVFGLKTALATGNLPEESIAAAVELLPEGTPEVTVRILARRLLEAELQAAEAGAKALDGEPLRAHFPTPLAPTSNVHPQAAPSPLLSKVIAEYAEAKIAGGKWTGKTRILTEGRFRTLVELIGDKPASAVTTADMRALQLVLPKVPANFRTVFPGLDALQAIEKADAVGREHRLSAKSINQHLFDLRSLYKWAMAQELVTKSPTSALAEVKDGGEKRQPFTDEDLRAIFGTLKEDAEGSAARWWVPHLLLYTGARLEEMCQLQKEDIKQLHGIWFFDVNREGSKRLKTENSERLVPVHSRLLNMGWLDYVDSVEGQHLFPELSFKKDEGYSAALSKWMGRRLRRVGITDPRKVASHSFRHTMATRLGSARVSPQLVDRIQGWADSSMRGNYTHEPEARSLKGALELFRCQI